MSRTRIIMMLASAGLAAVVLTGVSVVTAVLDEPGRDRVTIDVERRVPSTSPSVGGGAVP